MIKLSVDLLLPNGALFYSNINIYAYKELLKFIHQLSCTNIRTKCIECPFNSDCKYYRYTGENYNYYPEILIKNDIFTKTIYKKEETLTFIFYILDDERVITNYVRLFFDNYLSNRIAGHDFFLKNVRVEQINSNTIELQHLSFKTLFNNQSFITEYNNMIHYYNEKYHTSYIEICNDITENITNMKQTKYDSIPLTTKMIHQRGYLLNIDLSSKITIPSELINTGIGKYNFIGGGLFEIEDHVTERKL